MLKTRDKFSQGIEDLLHSQGYKCCRCGDTFENGIHKAILTPDELSGDKPVHCLSCDNESNEEERPESGLSN